MTDQNLHPQLNEYLQALKEHIPQRDPDMAAKGRAEFLSEVKDLQAKTSVPWFAEILETFSSFQIQVNRRLATVMASILIAIALTFGAVGGTVYASQDSLPNQTLYAVKTFTEDLRLSFANQPEKKINLLEKYANRRVEELSGLLENEEDIPQFTLTRLEQHTESMLKMAAEQEGNDLIQSLRQIRKSLQAHQAVIAKLMNNEQGHAAQRLSQVQKKLQEKIHLTEEGLDNPAAFREKMKDPTPFTPVESPGERKPEETRTPKGESKRDAAGTPKDKGKPEDAGTPKGKGKPADAGTPQGKGKPEDAGTPKGKPQKTKTPKGKGKPEHPGPPGGIP